MQSNGVRVVWVGADNRVAVEFYRGCGFSAEPEQPVYMTREIALAPKKRVSTLISPV